MMNCEYYDCGWRYYKGDEALSRAGACAGPFECPVPQHKYRTIPELPENEQKHFSERLACQTRPINNGGTVRVCETISYSSVVPTDTGDVILPNIL